MENKINIPGKKVYVINERTGKTQEFELEEYFDWLLDTTWDNITGKKFYCLTEDKAYCFVLNLIRFILVGSSLIAFTEKKDTYEQLLTKEEYRNPMVAVNADGFTIKEMYESFMKYRRIKMDEPETKQVIRERLVAMYPELVRKRFKEYIEMYNNAKNKLKKGDKNAK